MMITGILTAVLLQTPINTLTKAEKDSGWKLLFDGKSLEGWKKYVGGEIGNGWQVKDGVLSIVDPANAGDIYTQEQFMWFELSVDYRLTKGQNSGIMYRVQPGGEAPWHSGPEVQIYDSQGDMTAEISGYLYQLYKPAKLAENPVGEWNQLVIHVDPSETWVKMNGTEYYKFKTDSDDFWKRVAKTKFAEFPEFAKAKEGAICIQGDHGMVDFKNVKIRRFMTK